MIEVYVSDLLRGDIVTIPKGYMLTETYDLGFDTLYIFSAVN